MKIKLLLFILLGLFIFSFRGATLAKATYSCTISCIDVATGLTETSTQNTCSPPAGDAVCTVSCSGTPCTGGSGGGTGGATPQCNYNGHCTTPCSGAAPNTCGPTAGKCAYNYDQYWDGVNTTTNCNIVSNPDTSCNQDNCSPGSICSPSFVCESQACSSIPDCGPGLSCDPSSCTDNCTSVDAPAKCLSARHFNGAEQVGSKSVVCCNVNQCLSAPDCGPGLSCDPSSCTEICTNPNKPAKCLSARSFFGAESYSGKSAVCCNDPKMCASLHECGSHLTCDPSSCGSTCSDDLPIKCLSKRGFGGAESYNDESVVCCSNPSDTTNTDTGQLHSCTQLDSNGHCIQVDTAIGPISTKPADFVQRIFSFVLGIGGGIALILIIISGYKYMASQGNPEAVKSATEQLTSAIVGLLFIIFAFVILQIIGVDILRIPGFQ